VKNAPAAVTAYLDQVRGLNPVEGLRSYPGSPLLAAQYCRPQDSMRLFDLHPTDYRALDALLGKRDGVRVTLGDGFAGLKSLLPPPTRRGVVLIDPSYELDQDYMQLLVALRDAVTRFATGVYLVWYPQLQSLESVQLPRRLKALAPAGWLHAQLTVAGPSDDGYGLRGSGMFVLNPPYGLQSSLQTALPWLAKRLGTNGAGKFLLEAHTT